MLRRRAILSRLFLRPPYRHRLFTATTGSQIMVPGVLVPPLVFGGLLLALWTWKCTMLILFQDRLLYMSYMPPFARSEKIADYEAQCLPVQWKETYIRSLDDTKLALCVGTIPVEVSLTQRGRRRLVVVCYFQGNGGSTPPRLPLLASVLRGLAFSDSSSSFPVHYTLVALSYRGYWKSEGRASQVGIERDAQALLDWAMDSFASPDAGQKAAAA